MRILNRTSKILIAFILNLTVALAATAQSIRTSTYQSSNSILFIYSDSAAGPSLFSKSNQESNTKLFVEPVDGTIRKSILSSKSKNQSLTYDAENENLSFAVEKDGSKFTLLFQKNRAASRYELVAIDQIKLRKLHLDGDYEDAPGQNSKLAPVLKNDKANTDHACHTSSSINTLDD